jgi:hypothetical protein
MKFTDAQIDEVFDYVNWLCNKGNFEQIDKELAHINVSEVKDICELITWLSVTACCKSKLKNREQFVKDCRVRIARTDKKDVDALTKGLE